MRVKDVRVGLSTIEIWTREPNPNGIAKSGNTRQRKRRSVVLGVWMEPSASELALQGDAGNIVRVKYYLYGYSRSITYIDSSGLWFAI